MKQLSSVKQKVYDCIVRFKWAHNGNSPSIIEIGEFCGIKSTSTIRYHLIGLERLGKIACNYGSGKSRMIEVVGARWIPPAPFKLLDVVGKA